MNVLLDLVAPVRCTGCGSSADGELCATCARSVVVLADPLCPRCGGRLASPCPCARLSGFARARSLVTFDEPARSLTLGLKRRAQPATVRGVAQLLALLARREELFVPDATVVHVPGGRAARLRGFDNAELLARATARYLGASHGSLLVRSNEGPRQADVPMDERRANVRGRFSASAVSGHVLLVDDVYTTGATAEACALALLHGGATSVNVLTWARTLRRHAPREG